MIKLYSNSMSPNAKRVAICAYELGLNPDLVAIDFAKGEHKASDYLALNPNGKVPTMTDDGFTLWESSAMAWYLAEKNPSKGLLPADLKARADQMRWMFWNACHTESAIFEVAYERWIKPTMLKQETDEARCAVRIKELNELVPVLNARLEGREWLGDKCSLADVCLGVTFELCGMVNIDLSSYKHVTSWLGRLQARDSWKKASAK